jgi:hypothetical protein
MFSSTPICPVDPEIRDWIERRMNWLIDQFGRNRLLNAPVVLPRAEFFPDAYDGSDESVRLLLNRVCQYMGLLPETIHLSLYEERPPLHTEGLVEGTTGLYQEAGGAFRIWLEARGLDDPLALVATMAHELGHVVLLGQRRISPDDDDHEPLTDLLTVFLGLGVITANAVVRESSWTAGGWHGWSVSRQGYLTMQMYGYALALFAYHRNESKPDWVSHLRPDVRKAFNQGKAWLEHTGVPHHEASTAARFNPTSTTANAADESPAPMPNELAPKCSYCGSIADVIDAGNGLMCVRCRESVATNLESLVSEREKDEGSDAFARGTVLTFAALVAIGIVILIGRWIILSLLS